MCPFIYSMLKLDYWYLQKQPLEGIVKKYCSALYATNFQVNGYDEVWFQ